MNSTNTLEPEESNSSRDLSLEVPPFTPTEVLLHDFSMSAGDRLLLDHVDCTIPAGKLTVIVGASGSGKSTLLRLLAGLDNPVNSSIKTSGKLLIGSSDNPGRIGLVFQHFALLDELSASDNVQLAIDHSQTPSLARNRTASQWLDTLKVPHSRTISRLSGGQKQRLAIARTVASHPDVLLYDEPTSGLDGITAQQVARLVRDTQSQLGVTSIVVTHDYLNWLHVADVVLMLLPSQKTIVRFDGQTEEELHMRLSLDSSSQPLTNTESVPEATSNADPQSKGWSFDSRAATRNGQRFLEDTWEWSLGLLSYPVTLIPIWHSARWGMRFVLHYFALVAGFSAWVYLIVAGLIIGFVSTYFTFRFLPFEIYTKPLLLEELLASIGFALYRVLVPVLATVLIAARCGAAVAADVGGKRYGGQVDAMQTLGASPARYLNTAIAYSFLAGTPLLTELAFYVARLTSLLVFSVTHPQLGPYYWDHYFHSRLRIEGSFLYDGFGWLLLKTLLSGALVGFIAYQLGMRKKDSSREVSRGITSTVLWGTLAVLLVHFLVAFFEFESTRN